MPYRQVEFSAGHYYHVYNRGNNYQPIFFERENYLYFLRQMRKYLTADVVELIAYCLMPDHYHLLLYLKSGCLSDAMQAFILGYTKAINKRYQRAGALFQGRFKGKLVDCDEYLLHLSRYIHLNPVLAGLVKRPEEWEFSSYGDYVGLQAAAMSKPDVVISQFLKREDYRAFVEAFVESDARVIQPVMLD